MNISKDDIASVALLARTLSGIVIDEAKTPEAEGVFSRQARPDEPLAVGCCRSCHGGRVPPLVNGFTTILAKRVSGDRMALHIEGVVDGGMGGAETLR